MKEATTDTLDEIRDFLRDKLPGQGFILLTGDKDIYVVTNACEKHFVEIMEGVLEAAKKLGIKH